ncbi:MAG: helix-turn-helix transcriptional regulator [Candidatus Omnitrophica bacterium]|nr:helix-turn-helix transcriptional regulator [Candidatus Omnitrophota bacterium]
MIRLKEEVIKNWLKNKTTPPRTIEELAELMKIEPSLLYMIFSDDRQVTPNVLRRLCEVTGYDVGDLCFYDRNKEEKDS